MEAARSALSAQRSSYGEYGDLVLTGTASIGGTTIVRFAETRFGVRVLGRGASVTIEHASGRAEMRVFTLRAEPFPERPTYVDATEAARRASDAFGFAFAPGRAHLVYLPDGRLVHRVPALVPETVPRRPVAVVDATDGRVILLFDAARRAGETLAHRTNPIASPTLERLPLPLLDSSAAIAGGMLDANALRARSCVDRGTTRRLGGVTVHVCDVDAEATGDENGDFLVSAPLDAAMPSPFAETQAFFHAATAARWFRDELGLPDSIVPAVTVVANVRMPPGWTSGDASLLSCATCPLEPLPNAFYAPDDPAAPSTTDTLLGIAGDAIWLGLGSKRSFAVDGDIVHHEWAHAVIEHTIGLVATPRLDEQGVSFAPGSASEALADHFSAALSGDAKVGEWASGEAHAGEGTLRDLDGEARCPDALVGEVHGDSLVLSQALYRVRRSRTDARAFDRGLVKALLAAPSGDLSTEELAAVLLASLPADDASALRTELIRRGLLPVCTRVLDVLDQTAPRRAAIGRGFVAPGRRVTGITGSVPPIVQFRRAVPERARSVTVTLRRLASATPAALRAALRFGSPVTYGAGGVHVGEEAVTTGPFIDEGGSLRATFAIPETRTGYPLHLAIESESGDDARYDDVALTFEIAAAPAPDEGCGCTTAGRAGTGSAWVLLLVLAGRTRRPSFSKASISRASIGKGRRG